MTDKTKNKQLLDRVTVIVLDSCGCGELPDAADFGDSGSNTLGNLSKAVPNGLKAPIMESMGLGNLTDIKGCKPTKNAIGGFGKANSQTKGKDTTSGHWEMTGCVLDKPFPTYSNGFSDKVIKLFEEKTGRKVIKESNIPISGTTIINQLGEQQLKTKEWIVYTSADPVFQIAAHEDIIPVKELYKACEIALEICNEHSPVARVIARPYIGKKKGEFKRTPRRHDFSVQPPKKTILDKLKEAKKDVIAVGKINDIFVGRGITQTKGVNKDNLDGIKKTIQELKKDTNGFIFVNLVDYDMKYGHRRDPQGYANALTEFDNYLPEIMKNLKEKEILIITADHGCDPTYKGTDHTREYIPILIYGKNMKKNVNIGTRKSFDSIGKTVIELILGEHEEGSFAKELF